MFEFGQAFAAAFRLIAGFDADLVEIVGLSLRVSLSAVALAALVGLPLGAAVALYRFPGRMIVAVTWSMSADDNTHGYDFGGEAVKGDTEQLLGLIDYETGEFVAVETEEPGTVFGELLPDGRIRVRLAQPGEKPVVLHTTLTRTAR